MLFYYSQSLIFLLSKNGLDILQLLSVFKNRRDIIFCCQKSTRYFAIKKSTRYFATCTKNRPDILLSKNRPDILLSKNRPDILLSKNRPDIFKVVQKSTRYFAAKKSSRFLVENRPIKVCIILKQTAHHNCYTVGRQSQFQFTLILRSLPLSCTVCMLHVLFIGGQYIGLVVNRFYS